RHVPGKPGDVLGRRLQKSLDVAAAGEMFPRGTQHNDANAPILVQCLEHEAELIALRHGDNIEGRAIEDDVGTLACGIGLDTKCIERSEAGIAGGGVHVTWPPPFPPAQAGEGREGDMRSGSYSPAISLRRRSLPTGDFGIASTNTYRRGRLKLASPDVRQNWSSSSGSTVARRLTKAATTLPQRSSARPITATSLTAGCSARQLSTSTADARSPP